MNSQISTLIEHTRNQSMRLPNLIVAGAPKCGTSSLFSWLAAHPEVCGSYPKEPYYFMDVATPLFHPEANYDYHGLNRYASFFRHCSPQAKVLLEATPHYMYQDALNFFASLNPQPQIIFVLRKPSRQIFFYPDTESLHRLDDYFVPYNQRLAQAFDLNLDCWR